ncbi:MAG: hypothetical protein DI551_05525 [Micavibrio aeruginosavorus]|uniref:Uncharacterized protein n=1 Tax=Micavibrio aeruginosavorus TaxID=349221 RepID=A0A2W5Q4B3_9BACT|nr:MAG: hypothetical protein DI551_05525 [Micavibrio aeruginosavorus]
MFSIEGIDFESIMNRHLFDGHPATVSTTSSNSSDFFMCNDDSNDSDLYSGYHSDQENTLEKL